MDGADDAAGEEVGFGAGMSPGFLGDAPCVCPRQTTSPAKRVFRGSLQMRSPCILADPTCKTLEQPSARPRGMAEGIPQAFSLEITAANPTEAARASSVDRVRHGPRALPGLK